MKNLDDINYYEILQVPSNASMMEIKQAYQDALSMYGEESLVTYSLLPDDDRIAILNFVETAYATLTDEDKRAAYDTELAGSGRTSESKDKKDPSKALSPFIVDKPKDNTDIDIPVISPPVSASDDYRREMIQTIDQYRRKLKYQKFDKREIRNHLKILHIKENVHKKGSLSEIEPDLEAISADIEKASLRMRRNISLIILFYSLIALTGLILISTMQAFMLPSFNIPYSVLFMGLVGCIVSMYLKLPNIRAYKPLRYDLRVWFIIFPPIAVILAGLSYGILQILLSLFSIELPDESWIFRILAFAVGFVNWVYFYDRIKRKPVHRTNADQDHSTETA